MISRKRIMHVDNLLHWLHTIDVLIAFHGVARSGISTKVLSAIATGKIIITNLSGLVGTGCEEAPGSPICERIHILETDGHDEGERLSLILDTAQRRQETFSASSFIAALKARGFQQWDNDVTISSIFPRVEH